jgi:hypothetical protein
MCATLEKLAYERAERVLWFFGLVSNGKRLEGDSGQGTDYDGSRSLGKWDAPHATQNPGEGLKFRSRLSVLKR